MDKNEKKKKIFIPPVTRALAAEPQQCFAISDFEGNMILDENIDD